MVPDLVSAQSYWGKAEEITDSILHSRKFALRSPDDSQWSDAKIRMYDSVYWELMAESVVQNTATGTFTFPAFFFEGIWHPDVGRIEPDIPQFKYTPTRHFWLEFRYNIYPDTLQQGCDYQSWWYEYDSLMYLAIVRYYGADFFQQAGAEADSLDEIGAGLSFPTLDRAVRTGLSLKDSLYFIFKEIDTASFINKETHRLLPEIIAFDFRKGKLFSATFMNLSIGRFVNSDYLDLQKKVQVVATSLPWEPPEFLNKPIDITVYWSIKTGELFW